MRRIKLVVGVLAMLVVMVGSAVPAMAQQRGDHGNRGPRLRPGLRLRPSQLLQLLEPLLVRVLSLLVRVLSLLTMAGTTSSK